jgi:hypothetical protein
MYTLSSFAKKCTAKNAQKFYQNFISSKRALFDKRFLAEKKS